MSKMKIKSLSMSVLVLTLVSILAISASYANSNIKNDFVEYYPSVNGTKLDNCTNMCHNPQLYNLGSRSGNFYAKDLQNSNLNFSSIEGLDSDGDGVTNIDEIIALTFPGDITDFTTTTTTTTTTSTSTNTTTTTTSTSTNTTTTTINTTTTTTIQQQEGETLYQNYCASCHGEFAKGETVNEDVRGESANEIREAINKESEMIWLSFLSVNETQQISNYLQTLDGNNEDESDENDATLEDNNTNVKPKHTIKILEKTIKRLEKIVNQFEKLNLPEEIKQSILESFNSTLTQLDEARNLINSNDITNSIDHHNNERENNDITTYRHGDEDDDRTTYRDNKDNDDDDEKDEDD